MTPGAGPSSRLELSGAELELLYDALRALAATAGDNASKRSRDTIRDLLFKLSGPAMRAGAQITGPPRLRPEMVTIAEAAAAWGYSIGHFRRMVAEGQIPGAEKFSGIWRVPLEKDPT